MSKDIFIGSSTESRHIAEKICEELNCYNIKARPWWNEFEPGTFTLPRLLELSRRVDGAIFVFGKDDETWYRGTKVFTARDNVVFEWGLFISRLEPERCIVFCGPEIKMLTDASGLTVERYDPDKLSVTKLSQHFKKIFSAETFSDSKGVFIIFDSRLGQIQIADHLPKSWLLRGFYLGLDGAKAWLAACTDPVYKNASGTEKLRNAVLAKIVELRTTFRTFVSLGPGDGILDEDIILELKKDEPALLYVPVDISDGLLIGVCETLKSKVAIPVALLADFEGHLDFVASNVKHFGKSPMLYALLGGTFGNLDTNEHRFLGGLIASMSCDDVFLFDIALNKAEPGAIDKAPNVHGMSAGRKSFYSHGAARVLGKKSEDIFAKFEDYVTIELCDTPSDISGTKVVVFSVEKDGAHRPFAYMRRYNLDNLVEWIIQKFRVEVQASSFPSDGLYGRALLTLKKKPRGHLP